MEHQAHCTHTEDEENLHSQVTDTRGTTGRTGLPCGAHAHAVRHGDSHVECGQQDEAIPGSSQGPTVQQDEGRLPDGSDFIFRQIWLFSKHSLSEEGQVQVEKKGYGQKLRQESVEARRAFISFLSLHSPSGPDMGLIYRPEG